ncbi:hypothetical protein F4818DRAFT_415661 [Hypoxylon cercidicola]|nr:hypothetical protein F4818DRAFT_415661 [Hypoxylon cercidicola]
MTIDYTPRSVADATRFTSNTPHAKAKAASTPSSATSSSPQASPRPSHNRTPPPGMSGHASPETIEERVRRLRAAHLAARKHETSRFDRVVDVSRRYFDAAHKFTVMGLIGFSGLALFVTLYATADMMVYNRKRRNEFFALRKQLRADSLEAARLAYMTGTASDEQVALVEDAEAKARQSGMSLPPLLSVPKPAAEPPAVESAERSAWPGEAMVESSMSAAEEVEQPKKKGLSAWLFGGLKEEEAREKTFNFEEEAAAATSGPPPGSSLSKVVGESRQVLKDKAKSAFEQERENQRKGGPLDQIGSSENQSNGENKRRGWW